jgi:hypothetical protein
MSIRNTARKTGALHPTAIHRPTVGKRPFSRLMGEPFDPSKVSTTMSVVVAKNVRDEAARIERLLDTGNWREVALSDCKYGCKIYRHAVTGEERVEHNSVYGCPEGKKVGA